MTISSEKVNPGNMMKLPNRCLFVAAETKSNKLAIRDAIQNMDRKAQANMATNAHP
jgi:hypothetical protein